MSRQSECGSVTLFFTVTVAGLLIMIGLIVDSGAKINLAQRSDDLAAQAARAAGQAVTPSTVITGGTATADPTRAVRAAQAFLTANGATGTVQLDPDRQGVTVTVTLTTPTVFLGLVGMRQLTATRSVHARLFRSVTGELP
jgi:Flp pilus assembly protein TadG